MRYTEHRDGRRVYSHLYGYGVVVREVDFCGDRCFAVRFDLDGSLALVRVDSVEVVARRR